MSDNGTVERNENSQGYKPSEFSNNPQNPYDNLPDEELRQNSGGGLN